MLCIFIFKTMYLSSIKSCAGTQVNVEKRFRNADGLKTTFQVTIKCCFIYLKRKFFLYYSIIFTFYFLVQSKRSIIFAINLKSEISAKTFILTKTDLILSVAFVLAYEKSLILKH